MLKTLILGDEDISRLDALFAALSSIGYIASIVLSIVLLKGISERNPAKVSYYKWFTIMFLIFFIVESIYTFLSGFISQSHTTEKQHKGQFFALAMITILFTIYELIVIHSLEMMYRENPLPLTQPGITYQMYPQQPIILTQPPPSHDYKHPSAPYPENPPNYSPNNSFPVKS